MASFNLEFISGIVICTDYWWDAWDGKWLSQGLLRQNPENKIWSQNSNI